MTAINGLMKRILQCYHTVDLKFYVSAEIRRVCFLKVLSHEKMGEKFNQTQCSNGIFDGVIKTYVDKTQLGSSLICSAIND